MNNIIQLQHWIQQSKKIVFFGGAGVSTESGIPDFRSARGLYADKDAAVPPERIISASYFYTDTKAFYRFYKSKMLYANAKPNNAHLVLADLEKAGKLSAVVTQNIDGLHQLAGSKNVIELHGSVHRNYCVDCGKVFGLDIVLNSGEVPVCSICGGIVKPDVVLYEEPLPDEAVNHAIQEISRADLLIIGGTSLLVHPAASLVQFFSGAAVVLINLNETPADSTANLVIHDSVGSVLRQAVTDIVTAV